MCGRFTLTSSETVVLDLFELRSPLAEYRIRYNVAPTQDVLAVRIEDEERAPAMLRWGLVPSWADDVSIGNRMINARAETVAEKPAFRDSFTKRRCLVVADGFIEWKRSGRQKEPHWIQLRSGQPFGMAGIWDRWRGADGQWLHTCSILTTTPNDLMKPIHDRMPVMVAPQDHEGWLRAADPSELLRPFDASQMIATAVSTRINSVANDDPRCLEKSATQGSLF